MENADVIEELPREETLVRLALLLSALERVELELVDELELVEELDACDQCGRVAPLRRTGRLVRCWPCAVSWLRLRARLSAGQRAGGDRAPA